MELTAVVPDWFTLLIAGSIGVLAIGALTRTLEVVFDLDRG